jgi:hypothetical protein
MAKRIQKTKPTAANASSTTPMQVHRDGKEGHRSLLDCRNCVRGFFFCDPNSAGFRFEPREGFGFCCRSNETECSEKENRIAGTKTALNDLIRSKKIRKL